jgi:hypothetical protein
MRDKRFWACALLALSFSGSALSCEEEEDLLKGDYANCGSAVLPAQKAVCDDLLTGVVRQCGFELTVDPCACVAEVEGCTADTGWLSIITSCRENASGCVEFVDCLEGMGASPSGCSSPATWECIVSTADAGGE